MRGASLGEAILVELQSRQKNQSILLQRSLLLLFDRLKIVLDLIQRENHPGKIRHSANDLAVIRNVFRYAKDIESELPVEVNPLRDRQFSILDTRECLEIAYY